MLRRNAGLVDRIVRSLVGLALIAGYFAWPDAAFGWAFWLGLIPLAAGLVGWCPINWWLGVSTRTPEDG